MSASYLKGLAMTTSDWLSALSALIALGSLLVARWSLGVATQQNLDAREARDLTTIAACNQRYLDWCGKGPHFDDANWCYGLWDLIATEFNFFRHGWLPLFMFRFWMNTLGTSYAEHPGAWPSHQEFLATYAGSSPEMEDFFREIWKIARDNPGNAAARNRQIGSFVDRWQAAICPWTPRHSALQRDKMTPYGTAKKRPA
jgi:hypothetical protein